MTFKISSQMIGIGDNRRGPQTPPVPYPPRSGDGDNIRGATRPEGIPAGMYGVVPPIGWTDSGIPGIFVRDKNVMWSVNPPKPNEVKLDVRIVETEGNMTREVAEITGKLRFNQKKVFEDYTISGPTPLDLTEFPAPKMMYISCAKGEGTVKIGGTLPYVLSANQGNSTYAFFNYSGVPNTILFDGDCVVDVLLFQ